MLIVLFRLYRIAYPKKGVPEKDNEIPSGKPEATPDVMGKSRFVLPDRSQSLQTPAINPETEKAAENAPTFAAETGKNKSAVIPSEQLNEVFGDDSNPEIMSLSLEEWNGNQEEDEIDWEEEEAEEMQRVSGEKILFANGIGYDDLQEIAAVIRERPAEVSEETGQKMVELEGTDMFEQLVSGNKKTEDWVKSVVERIVQNMNPEPEPENENEESNMDYNNFDVSEYYKP